MVRTSAVIAAAALVLTGCGSSSGGGGGGSTASGGSSSGGSAGGKTLTISTDLPLQGSSKDSSDSINNAIKLYLEQQGNKAGSYNIQLKTYDDSTAAAGGWDGATCTQDAQAHVANASEVAVMGTYNSGCAKIEVPVLNQATDPMLMVSNANTNPGLTKAWDKGEPDLYYPTGKRNYARVITTDDYQGKAAAAFAATNLKVKSCYIVNDNSTYGQGVARAFQTSAAADGIKVLGNQAWDKKQTSYAALFTKIKATNPDCIYVAGTYDQNGGQLLKDKFSVLGNNTKVKVIAPDGFTGFPEEDKQAEAQGIYLTFAGLASDQLLKQKGAGATFLAAYKAKYGSEPVGSYPLYGVAAVQVILAAIAKSDGTRAGVLSQVFSGSGITIPATQCVLGKSITINPATGDVNAKDISVLELKNKMETYLKAQAV